jgi:hypothetical protein
MSRARSPALDTGRTPRTSDFIVSRSRCGLLQKNPIRAVAITRKAWRYLAVPRHSERCLHGPRSVSCTVGLSTWKLIRAVRLADRNKTVITRRIMVVLRRIRSSSESARISGSGALCAVQPVVSQPLDSQIRPQRPVTANLLFVGSIPTGASVGQAPTRFSKGGERQDRYYAVIRRGPERGPLRALGDSPAGEGSPHWMDVTRCRTRRTRTSRRPPRPVFHRSSFLLDTPDDAMSTKRPFSDASLQRLPLTSDRRPPILPLSFDRSNGWLPRRQTSSRARST